MLSINEHVEHAICSTFAAVSDIGKRHTTNDDSACIRMLDKNGVVFYIMAVCDGLSSTVGANAAARAAAETTVQELYDMINTGAPNPANCMVRAVQSAHNAVCQLTIAPVQGKDPPGTTVVAAVAWKGHAVVGWVGDSRAYLFSETDAKLLTHDHSWINEVVDGGMMSLTEAAQSPNAHVITRCLGPVETINPPEVSVVEVDLPARSRLVLCTDGLWNYVPDPHEFAELMSEAPQSASTTDHARALVNLCNEFGGHDNITLAICDFN